MSMPPSETVSTLYYPASGWLHRTVSSELLFCLDWPIGNISWKSQERKTSRSSYFHINLHRMTIYTRFLPSHWTAADRNRWKQMETDGNRVYWRAPDSQFPSGLSPRTERIVPVFADANFPSVEIRMWGITKSTSIIWISLAQVWGVN